MSSCSPSSKSLPALKQPPPAEPGLKCPRCDSTNTKFCYYNNYSLSQPRHYCKTCRRYWTKGGTLRNVPVGGGSRKTRKSKSNSSSSSNVSNDAAASFQLSLLPTHFVGFNYPVAAAFDGNQLFGSGGGNSGINNSNIAAFESLSSMNQDLHWRLQQQRLAVIATESLNVQQVNSYRVEEESKSLQVNNSSSTSWNLDPSNNWVNGLPYFPQYSALP